MEGDESGFTPARWQARKMAAAILRTRHTSPTCLWRFQTDYRQRTFRCWLAKSSRSRSATGQIDADRGLDFSGLSLAIAGSFVDTIVEIGPPGRAQLGRPFEGVRTGHQQRAQLGHGLRAEIRFAIETAQNGFLEFGTERLRNILTRRYRRFRKLFGVKVHHRFGLENISRCQQEIPEGANSVNIAARITARRTFDCLRRHERRRSHQIFFRGYVQVIPAHAAIFANEAEIENLDAIRHAAALTD